MDEKGRKDELPGGRPHYDQGLFAQSTKRASLAVPSYSSDFLSGGRERAQTIDSGSKNGVSYQSVHKMRSSGTGASEAPELGLL